jgi:integrase
VFYRAVYIPGRQGCSRKALDTTDKSEAERLAKELIGALLQENNVVARAAGVSPTAVAVDEPAQRAIPLRTLWERYSRECDEFLDNAPETRADAERSAKLLMAVFGGGRDVRTISARDVAQYVERRKRGGIRYHTGAEPSNDGTPTLRTSPAVRQTAVHRDLTTLRTMLRWARTVVTSDGRGRWLELDPLEGLRFEKERSPKRPVASADRYEATQKAVRQLAANESHDRGRLRWLRLELALFLARATGRRRGSIVGLQWEDIDFGQRRITWRAEHDKKRVEWVTPMSAAAMDELRRAQRELGSATGYLFPSKRHPSGHIPGNMLGEWLREVERRAKLPKLAGGLWHPYRRGWASERMHFPLKAVADAGGWKDVTTLVRCYQQTDERTLLAVMANDSSETDRADGVPAIAS